MQSPVLILGGSGGIGAAIARRLSTQGHTLILHGRDRSRLDLLVDEIGPIATAQIADLTDEGDVASMFARIAAEHSSLAGVIFSVASPFPRRLTHRTAWRDFQGQIDTQLKALHLSATAAFPLMADKTTPARFVVLSSEAVLGVPEIKMASYIAAKAAITAYARVVAQEWISRGIRVYIVAPGLIRTELVSDLPEVWLDSLASTMPERRLTSTDDIADMAAFLMTDAADCLYGLPLQVSRGERR